MGGGEADTQTRGARGYGGRADGGHVVAEGGELGGCLERAFFVTENDGMDRGGERGIKQSGERAQVMASFVTFRTGAKIERGGGRGGVRGGCGGGENEAARAVDEKVDERP